MGKLTTCLAFLFVIYSCREPVTIKTKPAAPENSELETFLRDFVKKNSQSDSINSLLEKQFLNRIDHGILSDLPLKLEGVKKLSGSKYAAHFSHVFQKPPGMIGINLDLVTLIDQAAADTLTNDSSYLVNGVNAFNISKSFKPFMDGPVHSSTIRIKKAQGVDADLGVIMITAKSIAKK